MVVAVVVYLLRINSRSLDMDPSLSTPHPHTLHSFHVSLSNMPLKHMLVSAPLIHTHRPLLPPTPFSPPRLVFRYLLIHYPHSSIPLPLLPLVPSLSCLPLLPPPRPGSFLISRPVPQRPCSHFITLLVPLLQTDLFFCNFSFTPNVFNLPPLFPSVSAPATSYSTSASTHFFFLFSALTFACLILRFLCSITLF